MKKEAYKFQFNKNIVVTLSDERLITPSGLCMVGQIFGKSSLAKKSCKNENRQKITATDKKRRYYFKRNRYAHTWKNKF